MRELSLHILDIARNSVSARATLIEIAVNESYDDNLLEICISDNGCGMSETFLETVTDPFSTTRTSRKVGLGIPLMKFAAESAGGSFDIKSVINEGTNVYASFELDNIDRAPLGDIGSTIITLLTADTQIDIVFSHHVNGEGYIMDTRELRKLLGNDMRLDAPKVIGFIDSYLKENEEKIYGGAN